MLAPGVMWYADTNGIPGDLSLALAQGGGMNCARCKRPLKAAAVTLSGVSFGPRCAKILGLMPTATRRKKAAQRTAKRFDDGQATLFEVAP